MKHGKPQWKILIVFLAVISLITALWGCSSDSPTAPPDEEDPPQGGTTIDETGGSLSFHEGSVELVFPEGAVAGETTITVLKGGSGPAHAGFISETDFQFGPDGLEFSEPVQLIIHYAETDFPAGVLEDGLRLCKVAGDTWQEVGGFSVDYQANTVAAPISSFSTYAVLGVVLGDMIYQGNYSIESQQHLDDFQVYSSITGSLGISSLAVAEVELPNLVSIGENLYIGGEIFGTQVLTRVSLPALQRVAVFLKIKRCDLLTDLDLSSLSSVGTLIMEYNDGLTDLDGFSNLSSLNPTNIMNLGSISISHHDNLRNLDGLSRIGGEVCAVVINDCQSVDNLSGLGGISSCQQRFEVGYCDSLFSLAGLSLTQIGGDCIIWHNNRMQSLTGLDRLHTIEGSLQVESCPVIFDLTGLSSLQSVGGLTIRDMPGIGSLDGIGPIYACNNSGLILDHCFNLTDLGALQYLQSVAAVLYIEWNHSLESLAGLESLTHVESDLRIEFNASLETFDGLVNLDHAWGRIYIYENYDLIDVSGLLGLQPNPATGFVCENFQATNNCDFMPCIGNGVFEAIVADFGGEGMVEWEVVISGN